MRKKACCYIIIVSLLFVCFACISKSKNYCKDIFILCKNNFYRGTNLDTSEVLSHFPKTICRNKHQRLLTLPLFGDNSGGLMYLESISSTQINTIKASYSFKDSVLYYSPDAFRIRRFIFNDTATFFDTSVLARYPVPTFYLGLNNRGKLHKEWLYEVDSVKNLWKQTVYIVPKDIMVYIIDAKDGFFWKEKEHNLPRPFLGKWTSGYSRGIAISEKEKIICYWIMIW